MYAETCSAFLPSKWAIGIPPNHPQARLNYTTKAESQSYVLGITVRIAIDLGSIVWIDLSGWILDRFDLDRFDSRIGRVRTPVSRVRFSRIFGATASSVYEISCIKRSIPRIDRGGSS